MELKWTKGDGKIAVAFMPDSDAEVMQAMGYESCYTEDYIDETGEWVEVWTRKKEKGEN